MKSFSELSNNVQEFKNILSTLNIDFQNSNALLEGFDTINFLSNFYPHRYTKYIKESEEYFSVKIDRSPNQIKTALFLIRMMNNIIFLKSNPELLKLTNHLKLITETNFAQNLNISNEISINIEKNNKIWELYLASSLLKSGNNIHLENPFNMNKDKNPDIMIHIDNLIWGFACKVLNSSNNILNTKSYLDRLKDGIEQVEGSNVDRGIVIFNLKNVFPHEELLFNFAEKQKNEIFIFKDITIPQKKFHKSIHSIQNSIIGELHNIVNENKNDNITYNMHNLYYEYFKGKKKCFGQWVNFFYSNSISFQEGKIVLQDFPHFSIMGEPISHSIVVDLINKIHKHI